MLGSIAAAGLLPVGRKGAGNKLRTEFLYGKQKIIAVDSRIDVN